MNRCHRFIMLVSFLMPLLAGCILLPSQVENNTPAQDIPSSKIESYTDEMLSRGFEFCPDSFMELEITQTHENPQFNFYNRVSASGILELTQISPNQGYGLESQVEIPLTGEGWAGVCQFTSSGSIQFDLKAWLFPGESNQPALLVIGNCNCMVTSKPPCGDFGMIPLEETVFFTIPYQDGGTYERTWRSSSIGVSGSEIWSLHLPCED